MEELRCSSPERLVQDDITPRSQPAPHKAKMPLMHSMVPEVSLFFGNGANEACVPNIQNPNQALAAKHAELRFGNRPPATRPTIVKQQPPLKNSYLPYGVSRMERPVTSAAGTSHESVNSNPGTGALYNGSRGFSNASTPENMYSISPRPVHSNMPMSNNNTGQSANASPQDQVRLAPSALHPASIPPQRYKGIPHPANTQQPRLGYCDCPSCPKPQNGYYPPGYNYDIPRGLPPHSTPQLCHSYRPPPRPSYPGYPPSGQTDGQQYHVPPRFYPPPQTSTPYQPPQTSTPYPPPQTSTPYQPPQTSTQYPGNPYNGPPSHIAAQLPAIRTSEGATVNPPVSHTDRFPPTPALPLPNVDAQQTTAGLQMPAAVNPQSNTEYQSRTAVNPQPSVEYQAPSGGREVAPRTTGHGDNTANQRKAGATSGDVQPSNTNPDNSGRSGYDSGLKLIPDTDNHAMSSGRDTTPATGGSVAGLAGSGVQWDKVPPEIYQLLLQQDQQLKQLQAQISWLTATGERNVPKAAVDVCTIATNTSLAFPNHPDHVSAGMQTSPQKPQSFPDRNASQDVSQSGSSGCETRTPMEIRHRGHRPINSTQRDDGDLDMSQGELVALVNNLHDTTIDSVQSEMIVDLPSFQSSPTRSPRSLESCTDSMFLSPRSPISASMCETSGQMTATDYSDDEDPGDDTGTDNPEYYAKLMENIKKLLSQNTTEETTMDDYEGGVSSDPSTPVKRGQQNHKLVDELQSFLMFDTSTKNTDTTFIPRINYVSMFLDSDTDTSLEINSMAMKYLKDEQLTQLTKLQARNRLLKAPKYAAQKTAVLQKILKAEDVDTTQNVSMFGISPNDLTFATKKYMEKHGLLGGGSASGGTTPSETTCNESYHLRTDYNTMDVAGQVMPAGRNNVVNNSATPPTGRRSVANDSATPTNTHLQHASYRDDTPVAQTPYNDSGVSDGYSGTPKPRHTIRRTGDHRRFTPDRNDSYNNSGPKSQPHSQNTSPFIHNTSAPRQEAVNRFGAGGRFATPQITPAVPQPNHIPPDKDVDVPNNFHQELREYNRALANGDHEYIQTNAVNHHDTNRGVPNEVNSARNEQGVPNNYKVRQQFGGREETIDDDRILDITRLKQLPKLL